MRINTPTGCKHGIVDADECGTQSHCRHMNLKSQITAAFPLRLSTKTLNTQAVVVSLYIETLPSPHWGHIKTTTKQRYFKRCVLCLTAEHITCCRCHHLPQLCHSIDKLLLAELALRGGVELPCHDQDREAGWIQREVIAKLLDPIDTDLILIMRICQNTHDTQITSRIGVHCENISTLNKPFYYISPLNRLSVF